MSELHERIRELRHTLNLTQTAFAERLSMKQNSIAVIESGKRNISDFTLRNICREFHVNENWLRNGIGEIFCPTPNNVLDALAKEYQLSDAAYIMIEKFINLKHDIQNNILTYIQEVAETLQSNNILSINNSSFQTTSNDLSIEEKVEDYRRQLYLEEKRREKLSAIHENA